MGLKLRGVFDMKRAARVGQKVFNQAKLSGTSPRLIISDPMPKTGIASRRRYALLASCAITSLAAGLSSIPVDVAHAAGAVCGTFVAPATITNPAQGNPSNLAVNTACGFNAFAGPNVDGTPGNIAVGAYSFADGDSTAVGRSTRFITVTSWMSSRRV